MERQSADLYSPGRFLAFLVPPWDPKSTLGATRVGQKSQNGRDFFPGWGPGAVLGAPSKRVAGVILNAFRLVFDGFWAPGGHSSIFLLSLDGTSMILAGCWAPLRHSFKKTTRKPTYRFPQFYLSFFDTHSERDFCRPPRSIVA